MVSNDLLDKGVQMEVVASMTDEQSQENQSESLPNADVSNSSDLNLPANNHTSCENNKSPLELNESPNMAPDVCSSPAQAPNTDNLLDIVPKIALLGKEQAKKRLHAFSATKQSISPSFKRTKSKVEEKSEADKVEPTKKAKRSLNPTEKAKAVIEEIEEIKKIEHACYEAAEQRHKLENRSRPKDHKRSHHKERHRSRSVDKAHSKSWERNRYPENWREIKEKGYDQQTLVDMKSVTLKKDAECRDFRKQLLFETPSLLLQPFVYDDVSGKEKIVPVISRRITKAMPKISFSVTEKLDYTTVYKRACVLDYVPKSYRDNILKIITCSSRPLEKIPSKPTTRRWFPKMAFSNAEKETECTVLENSLGLSFLQNYSDEEEQDKEENKSRVNVVNNPEMQQVKKSKVSKRKEKKKRKDKKVKEKKKRSKKVKEGKLSKENNSEEKEWVEKPAIEKVAKTEEQKSKKNSDENKQLKKKRKKLDEKVEIKKDVSKKSYITEANDKKHKQKSSVRPSTVRKQEKLDKKEEVRKNEQSPVLVSKKRKRHSKEDLTRIRTDRDSCEENKKNVEITAPDLKCEENQDLGTPDTDEYHSNWESDELMNSTASKQSDLYTDTSGINLSWESDTDIPLSKSPVRELLKTESPRKETEDFSPFRDRFINDRRRSKCSLDNPSPPYLEMPLNIRNYRNIQWQEERHNSDRVNFRFQNDQKPYALYTEDSWEKDDYITMKDEEMRLVEDRRSLMEERRQFEMEKRRVEELERERYYLQRSLVEENCNEDRHYYKNYHSHREGEFERGPRRNIAAVPSEVTDRKSQMELGRRKKSRWQDIDANELVTNTAPSVNEKDWELANDTVPGKSTKKSAQAGDKPKPAVLENEYEKFMKALSSQTAKEKILNEKKGKKKKAKKIRSSSSSSSSSSDSSISSVTSSSSNSSKKRKKKVQKKKKVLKINIPNKQIIKIEDVERDLFEKDKAVNVSFLDIPLPKVEIPNKLEEKAIPLPVPSPKVDPVVFNASTCLSDAISVAIILPHSPVKCEDVQNNLKQKTENQEGSPKKDNVIPIKLLTPELRKLANESEISKPKIVSSPIHVKTGCKESQNVSVTDVSLENKALKPEEEVTTTEIIGTQQELAVDKSNNTEVMQGSSLTTKKSYSTKKEKDVQKRMEESSKTKESSSNHSSSPKRKKDGKSSNNISPISDPNRKSTLIHLNHFIANKHSKTEKESLQRTLSADRSNSTLKASPLSSPLDGFKRSVADSTISDDQLLQSNLVECTESPNVYKIPVEMSPRRMSLDERINQVLGIFEQPKPITTTYSNNANYESEYFDECFDRYALESQKTPTPNKQLTKSKVVQVGNILQVVPTEDYSEIPTPPKKKSPLQQNKVSNSTQKILQVGNMLQIVPTTTFPDNFEMEEEVHKPVGPVTSTPIKSTFNAEMLVKQKAERRAEKDKRKEERQLKRKEKEKKRKERERRKQLKVKLQTEASIKQALILEDINLMEEDPSNEPQKPAQWPPIPQIVANSAYRPPGKGILSQRREDREEVFDKRKQVLFSDGVRPGEGTSPSGGEELSSPPPAPRKLPKEKRFKKLKLPKKEKAPKKKKVKVKVIRRVDEESEEDMLPPPPPPPGSPPPHIFPARIKEPIFNNIHSNLLASITNPPDTSYPPPVFRPNPPVVMPHHIPLHPPGPPPQVHHHHHLPSLPSSIMHHGGFNQIPHGNHR